jgi:hypothetical protein
MVEVVAAEEGLGVGLEEFHGEMDAVEGAAFDGEVAGFGGAGAEDDGVEFAEEAVGGVVAADVGLGVEDDALFFHLFDTLEDEFFVELHVGDAVHEEAAEAVGAFEDGDEVAGVVGLGGGAEAGGAGADDGDFFAGAKGGGVGLDPAFGPAFVGDGAFDVFDGDGRGVDAEDAGAFAGSGADAAGEVGEVIGFMEAFEGFAPEAAVNEVVPFGDEVVDGTAGGHAAEEEAGVAEGNAAVHAAGALLAEFGFVEVQVELVPVADAFEGGAVEGEFAEVF